MRREPRFAAKTVLCLALAAAASAADPPPDGAKLFQANCESCHGREGKALPFYAKKGVPDLNDPEWQKARSDDDIRTTISEGSEGTVMKSFKKILTPEQIAALVKHVRTLGTAAAK